MDNLYSWIQWGLGIMVGILGWLHKQLYSEHRALQEKVHNVELASATRSEIDKLRLELKDDIYRGFDRIHSRLDKIVGGKEND